MAEAGRLNGAKSDHRIDIPVAPEPHRSRRKYYRIVLTKPLLDILNESMELLEQKERQRATLIQRFFWFIMCMLLVIFFPKPFMFFWFAASVSLLLMESAGIPRKVWIHIKSEDICLFLAFGFGLYLLYPLRKHA